MKNILSIYPKGVDSRIFFSDVNTEQLNIVSQFQELVLQGKYLDASQLLNNSEVFFYGSWVLNLFGNRLNKIGEYLLTKEKKEICKYQEEEPDSKLNNGLVWIGN